MKLVLVESSNLSAIAYDEVNKKLYVQFSSGGIYSYSDVIPEVHEQFMVSESKGRFFHANVKSAGYKYQRLTEEEIALLFGVEKEPETTPEPKPEPEPEAGAENSAGAPEQESGAKNEQGD